MNKDVDERLVPSGEYRHGVNIQVSTSEGSDVGTIQNILGNKEITMPSISNNSTCVGSISDEKNDAFYWFVRENYEETSSISEPRDIIFQYKNNTVTHVFVDKKQPRISVSSLSTPSSGIINISSLDGINALSVGDKLVNWTLNEISLGNDFVYVQSIDVANLQINVGDYTNVNWANIQDHGINFQIERDHVLDFPENTITGINIVDDMLFWTDNKSEPKVINIIRSILNTNQNGQQHTSFTNPETNQTVPIREEHVTVIKKSPKNTIDVEYGTTDAFAYGDTNPISMVLEQQLFYIHQEILLKLHLIMTH